MAIGVSRTLILALLSHFRLSHFIHTFAFYNFPQNNNVHVLYFTILNENTVFSRVLFTVRTHDE